MSSRFGLSSYPALADAFLLTTPARPDQGEREGHQEREAHVGGEENPRRKVVEDDAADNPDERDVGFPPLTSQLPQPVLPLRERAGNPRQRLHRDQDHRAEVHDPEGQVAHPPPSQECADNDEKLPADRERDVAEMAAL
jgi:hypothetical protein